MSVRAFIAVAVASTLALAGCASAPEPAPTRQPTPVRNEAIPNPIQGKQFYNDTDTQAHRELASAAEGSPEQKALRVITSRPTATWLTGSLNDAYRVERVTAGAAATKTLALLVFYNQPHRDSCSGSSAGGAINKETFLLWNQQMIASMRGDKTVVVVFAPDALAEIATNCLQGKDADERVAMFAEAIHALQQSPSVALTCIDAGHPGWVDEGAMYKLRKLLRDTGVNDTGCVSLNVSNSYPVSDNVKYVRTLNSGDNYPVAAIVDTSRNGGGVPPNGKWCNVPGRKLGPEPTTKTAHAEIYAFAYVKRPGQSDGNGEGCNPGDKPAGELDLKQAVSLARDEID